MFETSEFGLSSEGIHLLRSRYNYETVPFSHIQSIRFGKGRIVNNWVAILVIGLACVAFSIFYAFVLLEVFSDERVNRIYIEEILLPFLPLVFGVYMVYASLRTGEMMVVCYGRKTKRFTLERLKKEGSLERFMDEVNSHVQRNGKANGSATQM
ncbi:hypothetical protein DC20_19155 [Rufibacter tibetensis]|uniref:Uncharacterized protein n=2 Tax=Rufibacter tibetensis TaxID=512763 RepID=A0A0P0D1I7_9BACT|nr:hypothetical protein DC20_19155 [Rufibacter tibetensis]